MLQVGQMLRKSKVASRILLGIVLLSTSMILGDGVLTPAISVVGAVVGIQVAAPSITTGVLRPLSACLLLEQQPHL
jgi:KUP system potassium uptake protein